MIYVCKPGALYGRKNNSILASFLKGALCIKYIKFSNSRVICQALGLLTESSKSCDSWLKRERGRNLRSPFAIIWKLSRQNKIRKITSFSLHYNCIKHSKRQDKKYLEEYEHFEMLFELVRGFLGDEGQSHCFTETWF